jgi:SNF2 family DNA or RNA helicase
VKPPAPYPHQRDALAWLLSRPAPGHAMLASDPGLGKSGVGVMGADAVGAERVLIVCPAVMRRVWRREIRLWAELNRRVVVCETAAEVIAAKAIRGPVWVIIGWAHVELALSAWSGKRVRFELLISDEGHYAKNPESARTRALYGPACRGNGLIGLVDRVWVLTGTPILNGPHEMWSHYRALWPAAAGTERPFSYKGWERVFCETQETDRGTVVRGVVREQAARFRECFKAHVLRQRKSELAVPMPALRTTTVPLQVARGVIEDAKMLADGMGLFNATVAQIEAVLEEPGALIHLASLRRALGEAKAEAAAQLVLNDLDAGMETAVVFAWHTATLDKLQAAFARVGTLRIDGAVPMQKRDDLIQRFQKGGPERVFLAQITAAGVGVTLTRSSDIYLAEQAWTPAENAQAIQRVHRIGQAHPVLARFLYAEGTIDEAVSAVLARKAKTVAALGLD